MGARHLLNLSPGIDHTELAYRFTVTPDDKTAYLLERTIQRGDWPAGKPLLNPA